MSAPLQLITRADDAGSCRSANEAILECVEAGAIVNVSFMAVGPETEHAAELLRGRDDIACGLHVCLNAEWERVKWGPLTNARTLCDPNGMFRAFPHETQRFGFSIEEAVEEIHAQLHLLRELGLPISYVDEHMGVSWIAPELRAFLAELCEQEELIDAHAIPPLPDASGTGDHLTTLETRIENATGDKCVWVIHPGKIAPDMNAFYLKGGEAGVVARERDAERKLLCDQRLRAMLSKREVKICRYDSAD